MTNTGSPYPQIDGFRISGNWVRAEISGEMVFVTQSGMEIWVDISGDVVRLYGDTTGTGGSASGVQITNRVRVTNLSGVEPVIAQLTHAGDTSGQGIVVRTVNLSGTEPSIVQLTHAGDTSGQGITVRITNMSGGEPAIVQLAHAGDTSGLGIIVRPVNMSGIEPQIVQLTHAGDTSGQGIVVRAVNLSGAEPVIAQLTHAGDTSGQAVTVRVVNMSGVEPAIVTITHAGDTSGQAIAVRVANLSGTEPIVATVSGSIALLSGSITAIHSGTGPVFVTTMSGSIVVLASGTSIVGTFYDYAANSTAIIPAGFRVMNLSGTEPISVSVTSASVSGQPVECRNAISMYFAGASNAAVSAWLAVTNPVYVEHITLHQSAVNTTSGNLDIKLLSISGAVFDTTLYTDGTLFTNFFYQPSIPIALVSGEGIKVEFPNADSRNIGVRIASRKAN
jgi:hypothetical protein